MVMPARTSYDRAPIRFSEFPLVLDVAVIKNIIVQNLLRLPRTGLMSKEMQKPDCSHAILGGGFGKQNQHWD